MAKSFQKDTNGTLTTGLISYYKLGGVEDFYGSNNLTNNNAVPFSGGKVNNGASFSGSGAKSLSVGSGIVTTSTFSISMWVKSAGTQTQYAHPLSRYGTGGGLAFHYNYPTANVMNIYMNTGEGIAFSYNPNSDTNWHHLVVTSDGTTMRTYDNGTAGNTLTHNPNMGTSPSLYIGLSNLNAGREWYGLVDEVGFWSKALSTTEISDLYNSGNGQTMNPPIEFDNATTPNFVTATSLTYSHTCGAGANRILWVGVWGDTTSDAITGVTYGGTAMTLIDKVSGNTTGDRWTYLYYLINPATGANNVVVSASSSIVIGSDAYSYYGAKQSGVPDASTKVTQASNVTSQVTTLTTIADNCWTVLYVKGNSVVASTNTVKRTGDSGGRTVAGDSGNPITPAGSFSMTVTQSSAPMATVMASFAPYVASTTNTTNFFNFF